MQIEIEDVRQDQDRIEALYPEHVALPPSYGVTTPSYHARSG
jgi:hypothetical protein